MAGSSGTNFVLSNEHLDELCGRFPTLHKEGNGYLDVSELKQALDMVGFKIPQWQVRQIIEEMEKNRIGFEKGTIKFPEFQKLCSELKSKEVSTVFKTAVSKRENLDTLGGMSEASTAGTTHSVRHEEQAAFSDWINTNLRRDPDLQHLLPIDLEGKTLFDKVEDGILLCKIINHSCPDTIDERAINKKNLTLYTKHENLTLALNSSEAIGCNIINIDATDLAKKKPHLVLGLLWQIIRIGLFNQITLEHCPGLVQLVQPGEEMSDLMKLSPENILLRWVNYHLEKSETKRRISNFQTDIKDSEIYTHLLKQIAPISSGVTMEALMYPDYVERAEAMLKQADKIGCRSFLAPRDVVGGIYKLNLAFVANLFNNHPALDKPDEPVEFVNLEETREEKIYRNWMNSMGVHPYVNWIYSDLADGLVIFQLYDIIKPNMVDWNKVHKTFSKLKAFMEKLENCNYVVSLAKQLKFSLVGIAGQDICDGNPTLTLAVVWQLMRAYTLSLLTKIAGTGHPIVEQQIVEWVNNKLKEAGKQSSIRNFQDPSISNACPIIDLIDAIRPGSINYMQVLSGDKLEDRMTNAKYAISMARKIGARIYALPEDIIGLKLKMVMTVFACLMARDYIPTVGAKNNSENSE